MTDHDIMPTGNFKGRKMEEVPAWYLLGLLSISNIDPEIEKYILDNEDVLIQQNIQDSRFQ